MPTPAPRRTCSPPAPAGSSRVATAISSPTSPRACPAPPAPAWWSSGGTAGSSPTPRIPEAVGADFSSRPELTAALGGDRFQDQRFSDTLGRDILATAVPVFDEGRVVGAVRLTQSVEAVDDAVRRTAVGIAAVGLVVLLAALLAAYLLARAVTRPIERLGAAADTIASGDLDARAPVEGSREQRSLARSFNVMTERLARAVRAQAEFVADASHQLRTPLTGLRLRIEEARASTDPEQRRHHLDAGLEELDRMSGTIDDLLVLSRTGEREGKGEEVDLAEAAADARRRWERAAGAREIALTATHDGAGSVLASRADLDRAVDAVLENAIHYTPARRPRAGARRRRDDRGARRRPRPRAR